MAEINCTIQECPIKVVNADEVPDIGLGTIWFTGAEVWTNCPECKKVLERQKPDDWQVSSLIFENVEQEF